MPAWNIDVKLSMMMMMMTDALNILYEGMSEENNSTRALSFCIVIKNVRRILCSQNSYFLRENFSLFLYYTIPMSVPHVNIELS